jgi:biotin transport system substrate-specific component
MRERSRSIQGKTTILRSSSVAIQGLWIAGFALLTAAGARIEVLHQPVPYTLQTLMVLLSGGILGMRNGFLSQITYLALGCAGLPVFAAGYVGPAVLLGPTGGYLLAFPLAASIIGWLVQLRQGFWWTSFSLSIGLAAIFILGTLQLNIVYFHNATEAIKAGFLIFSWGDILKLFTAAIIVTRYAKRIRNLQ